MNIGYILIVIVILMIEAGFILIKRSNKTTDSKFYLCAAISVIIPVIIGSFGLFMANDGSIPDDWYKDVYFQKLIFSMTLGIMALTGFLCCVLNVYAVVKLIRGRNKKFLLYFINFINPVVSIILMYISDNLSKNMP